MSSNTLPAAVSAPTIGVTWSADEIKELEALKAINESLPEDAQRGLLSVRLSILTEDTTSPIRQELDLWRQANSDGVRVVGVARDLNVSATKVPPWKRKDLGDWLQNRVPEFDVLYFWKLDRFVRRILDLQVMIQWCQRYEKNLKSLNDPIDLSSPLGTTITTLIAAIAEIEAANTGVRVASLWEFNKTQDKWLTGAPMYGYKTVKGPDGKYVLDYDEEPYRNLRWVIEALLKRKKKPSAYRLCKILNRAGIPGPNGGLWYGTSLLIILRNPALMGLRTEERKEYDGPKRSQLVYGSDGKPIKVGPPIATPEEFEELQQVLDGMSRRNLTPWTPGATKFLGVISCARCGGNYTKRTSVNRGKQYTYLRCRICKSKGESPEELYSSLVDVVLDELGEYPVEHREYARGAETRKKLKEIEAGISHYMKELAPGGKFARGGFVQETAEETLNNLMRQMDEIDPEAAKDRWVYTAGGKTYREEWESGGMEQMSKDLLRAGIKFVISEGQAGEDTVGALLIPEDVKQRLAIREDHFERQF
ncbi:recombinase family protein [Streptomyces sp. NPDC001832]|uniref:recombinase family protein n=1 Tax=Streptomyces sp. NPDC001832 TaxID=3154527 RepID=UPI003330862A